MGQSAKDATKDAHLHQAPPALHATALLFDSTASWR